MINDKVWWKLDVGLKGKEELLVDPGTANWLHPVALVEEPVDLGIANHFCHRQFVKELVDLGFDDELAQAYLTLGEKADPTPIPLHQLQFKN